MKSTGDFESRLRHVVVHHPRVAHDVPGYLKAGVLVPVIVQGDAPLVLFTKRTELVETHKGQVSFPGGMVDPDDRSIEQTALREWEEEVGVPAGVVEVIGLLDDLPTPTGWIITPVVGLLRSLPPLAVNPHEVSEAFTVPLEHFANPANGRTEWRTFRGQQREVWYFDVAGHTIWGATGIIIRTLALACFPR